MLTRSVVGETMKYIIGKDVRKMLKRKDSDAGERGRALEELRTSVFSELRTSEGAKRLQQRFCGPEVALTFNFMIAVSIIMMNKLLLGKVGFNYPIFLTLIHYALSWLLLASLNACALLPASPPAKATPYTSLISLGVIMAFSNGLANVSLKFNSVGFYQMAKIAVTPTIVLSEFLFFGKRVSYQKVLALTVVSVGVAIATVTDLQFNLFGASIALTWIVPSAANKILWSNLQQQENWTALAATSATTHVVLGQFKTCVILLGGFLLFQSNPGMSSIGGAVVALGAMSVYTYFNLKEACEPVGKPLVLKQNSLSSLKGKVSKANDNIHDGNEGAEFV